MSNVSRITVVINPQKINKPVMPSIREVLKNKGVPVDVSGNVERGTLYRDDREIFGKIVFKWEDG